MKETFNGKVRKWLMENPGWHFDEDIQEGMGVEQERRKGLLITLANMHDQGMIERKGGQGMRRYKLGRLPEGFVA